MAGNKLIFLPPEISNLESLKYLDVSKNNIASIPGQAFRNLKRLSFLNLSTNALVSLPDEIGSCSDLSYLNMSDNGITHVPGSIFLNLKKLEYLFLFKNKIVGVPPEIGAATNLRIVSLANNKISSLPNGMGLLSNLEEFYVGGNTALRTLPGTVHGWKKIRAIYCQGCTKNEIASIRNRTLLDIKRSRLKFRQKEANMPVSKRFERNFAKTTN